MSSFAELRSAVRGRVLLPGDDGFEAAARPWNLAVPQPDAVGVVEAADADDVAALVRFARRAGVAVATQPAGHGASGTVNGAVLLRTALLDEVRVDPAARIARVGAGVKWGRVQEEASRHGLTGLPGSSPVVSVTGYTLGGGVSWFSRAHGWAADSVTAFEVVDAEGVPARVTAESDPELFWALRGGGGDYAIVTATEFRLHPAPALYGGQMLWPGAQAREVLDVFRSVTASAPDELTVWAGVLNPPVPARWPPSTPRTSARAPGTPGPSCCARSTRSPAGSTTTGPCCPSTSWAPSPPSPRTPARASAAPRWSRPSTTP
ncbi:FAD-binding oxidoreductase [Streptomyces sp. WAC 06738]|uniref:FAD-binding oxidoreductase n=1 Tax=Streptomyces sp. WAC 06738 TaxID=2203210 RepID=UPI001F0BBB34|nr:FAD-binding oxidoreductase [Streptomyces sp. WAC 06738]